MKRIYLFFLLLLTSWSVQSQETLWTSAVTSQPEGFSIEADGNIRINSGEGLAWLISYVNGLNGQTANDCSEIIVTLEDDIDISGNKWVAIGNQNNPFRGTFNGQGFSIKGIYMYDAWYGKNYGLFGKLDNATIKNVVIEEGEIVGYDECGGIAYLAENNTLIDRCTVKTTMSFGNNSGGIVGTNKDSKVSNCAVIPESYGAQVSCNGGIVGQNIATNNDAIIENCYSVSMISASYSTFYMGGIVGRNLTENDSFKAIVRNCYAAPMGVYGSYCGGIAGYNSEKSLIENSYTNETYEYGLFGDNKGETANCTVFFEDLKLYENVNVFDNNANNLLTALGLWVDNFPTGQYLSWECGDENTNYGFPFFASTESVNEINNNNIVLYPNPAEDFITIECDNITKVEIYNALGQNIDKIECDNNLRISTSEYNPGIYILRIHINNRVYTKKVVIK